ncbi:MAG: TIGR04255 family protein [Pseudomonadota bacterium]
MIEIRFTPRISRRAVDRAVAKLRPTYPSTANEHTLYEVNIDAANQKAAFNVESAGARMATSEQTDILLVLDDRFTRSRLAPYPGWDDFRDSVRSDWDRWRPIAKPGR